MSGKSRYRVAQGRHVPFWSIPAVYTVVSVVLGLSLPRLENMFLPTLTHGMSVGSALAFYGSISSGMMALTGIVFAIAFVMVQFSAVAYSPRLVMMFIGDSRLYHTLGIFFATFVYSLAALVWTDRGGTGAVPLISTVIVTVLLVASMFAFVRLVQSLNDMQIQNVLRGIGDSGRQLVAEMYGVDAARQDDGVQPGGQGRGQADAALPPVTGTIVYQGEPRAIASIDIPALVRLGGSVGGVVDLDCAVGDTLLQGALLARIRGAAAPVRPDALLRVFELGDSRTLEQDPKYPIRLLVDVAIRALSPAVNDPTTAVQALDQIEDLLRRLGQMELDISRNRDAQGNLRAIVPMPTWQDYLSLSFDEIRQFGVTSVQVMRRLRVALTGIADVVRDPQRREDALRYLRHLDQDVARSAFDDLDQARARQEDRQGLGMSRTPTAGPAP